MHIERRRPGRAVMTSRRSLADQPVLHPADPNNHQLIAISKTPDPTGAYHLYDFQMPNNKFNDYPKFGLRPDGWLGDRQPVQPGRYGVSAVWRVRFAFDRAKMLAGDPTAKFCSISTLPCCSRRVASTAPTALAACLPGSLDDWRCRWRGAWRRSPTSRRPSSAIRADQLRILISRLTSRRPPI